MSLFSAISTNNRNRDLLISLDEAINYALKNGRDEPSFIAHLTHQIPRAINRLKLNAGGYKLSAGSVFIHQTPKVTFDGIESIDDKKNVELGDLLLISTIVKDNRTVRKAMLFQAKMFSNLPVDPDNKTQHELYRQWPQFKYENSGKKLNGKIRKLVGHDIYSATKFLLISRKLNQDRLIIFRPFYFYNHYLALTAQPTSPLSNHDDFLKELYCFIYGDAGKSFEILPEEDPDIGWSRVINDLINETAQKSLSESLKKSISGASTRGSGVLFFGERFSFLLDDQVWSPNDNEPPEIPDILDAPSEEGRGISIVEFVIDYSQ